MEKWIGRVALVTGASSGIGAAVAERLVKSGVNVVGCAQNIQPIQELAQELHRERGRLFAIKCDLSKEEDIMAMFKSIKLHHGGIDICVNNAGVSHIAPLLSGRADQWRNMFDVNVLAPCTCTREAYASMKERSIDDGHIIHISSVSAYLPAPAPESSIYTATKWALRSLTESLRLELMEKQSNIRVTSISPGLVETKFSYSMRGEERSKALYTSIKPLEPSDIAESVEYALAAKPHVQVHDIIIRPVHEAF